MEHARNSEVPKRMTVAPHGSKQNVVQSNPGERASLSSDEKEQEVEGRNNTPSSQAGGFPSFKTGQNQAEDTPLKTKNPASRHDFQSD